MLTISAADVDRALTFPGLVETLRAAFKAGAIQPVRHHHTVERPTGAASTLLLMPAWTDFGAADASADGYIGVKVVTVSPDNNALGKPAVMGLYLLLDGVTGEPKALIDGQRLTQWRTACASALAADYLARKDASKLLVVGAGALAPFLAQAHAAVRPIEEIRIWNRTPANAEKVAAQLAALGHRATVADDLDSALGWADIVSAATIANTPLVKGALLKPGTHVDLVGGFTPAMRESDDDAISRATRLCRHARRRDQGSGRHRPAARVGPAQARRHRRRSARTRARREEGPRERRRDHAVQVGRRRARRSRCRRRGLHNARQGRLKQRRTALLRGWKACAKSGQHRPERFLKPTRDNRQDRRSERGRPHGHEPQAERPRDVADTSAASAAPAC